MVARRGIEPLFEEWKSPVLTPRRTGHFRVINPLFRICFPLFWECKDKRFIIKLKFLLKKFWGSAVCLSRRYKFLFHLCHNKQKSLCSIIIPYPYQYLYTISSALLFMKAINKSHSQILWFIIKEKLHSYLVHIGSI